MQPIDTVLRGLQQAIIPEIEAYWCENKPNPTHVVPTEQIERVTPSGWIATKDGQHLNPLHYTPEPPPKPRRYSRKGQASGSIKERIGNKKRKNPSTSYFYEWYEDGRKQRRYVQIHLMEPVAQLISQRRPCAEIIDFLNAQSRSTGRLHHTQEPKV